jgi:hypothetical protein
MPCAANVMSRGWTNVALAVPVDTAVGHWHSSAA